MKILKTIRIFFITYVILALSGSIWAQMSKEAYFFIPEQSTVVQTGGYSGINETHTVTGLFVLSIDFDANTAWFDSVNANLSASPNLPTQDLNELFRMTELISTDVNDTVIEFISDPLLGGITGELTLTFGEDDSVYMTGTFIEPWPDGFQFDCNAAGWQWANAEVIPTNPKSRDVVAIRLFGNWPDSCIPIDSNVSVLGNNIYFDVSANPSELCTQEVTPWEQTESVGPLSLGQYIVYSRLVGEPCVPETYIWMTEFTVNSTVFHVDGTNGDNTNDGLTRETAFKTIQRGINEANDGDTVLVWPAVYTEEILFKDKAIIVRSADDAAVLRTDYGWACSFYFGEGAGSVLKNFVIADSEYGIYLESGSAPTLENLTIVNCDYGVAAFEGSDPQISNCVFWNNYYGDLFDCSAKHSWIQDELPDSNLVAYWKFDEGSGSTAYDSAGSNNGTIYGATRTTGVSGDALDFDGEDDYVEVPDDDSLNPVNEISISYWIYNREYEQSGLYKWASCPSEPSSPGSSRAYALWACSASGKAMFRIFASEDIYDEINTNSTLTIDRWYHVAATFNLGEARLFIDGQLDNTKTFSVSSIMNDAQPLTIGARWSYCGTDSIESDLNGLMDEVRVYNRALSADEIEQIYLYGFGPMFADANAGDYHLKSERGRYWPEHDVWVLDDVTSPCIDAGDPNIEPSNEPMPNGGRINIGAYGRTAYASMSEWPLRHDGNFDGVVNFTDFAQLADEWLDHLPWTQNEPPDVSITYPEQGEMVPYNTIDPVIIEADASDSDGSVVKVEFFANGDKVAEDTTGYDGWQGPWHPVSDGDFTLTARATDDDGATTTSDAIDITIGYVW